ncbi:MAG: glycosyl hydrolase family 2 protein [Armatimonadota bacterium]
MDNLKNPSALMRPAPFWSWNDKLDEAELRRQIREMAEKGWGGYFMHSRVGLVTAYLSDEWMQLIRACADEAEKTGTYAWLYDEDKWPSGYAGGEVPLKDPAYRSRALVLHKQGQNGPDDTVLTSLNYNGIDYDICLNVSSLGDMIFNGTSYVDLMNPDAVREFINCTHERYKESCGDYFGKSIPGIFTDEPCYHMANQYKVPAVPWSDFIPEFFKEMKGYDIMENLALLFFDLEGYRKVRYDFYDAASELLKQSFTKPYYDWCTDNNLIMTGHFMAEDSLVFQTQWSGDVMTQYEFMHWPGIDKLGRHIDQVVTVKQVTSAVDQLGKERSFSEVFGAVGGQVSFFHRKWISDWQAALGISFINHHLSLYSMRGERKRDYPANMFYQQPWWDDEREFADYQGRLCAMVSEGERQVDILLFQPLSSVWSEYSPVHSDNGFLMERLYDDPFTRISHRLLQEKLDYHYGNESLMAKHASVDGDTLKVGQHAYKCVIVPPSSNIESNTLALLEEYAKNGGKLIFAGATPSMVDGNPQAIDIPGAQKVLTIEEAVTLAGTMFPGRVKTIDRITGGNAPSVFVHSRKMGNSVRHLIINTSDKREVRTRVEIPSTGNQAMAVFDLFDGSMYKLDAQNGTFDVTLYPAGSIVVVCGDEAVNADAQVPLTLGSGAVFGDLTAIQPATVIDNLKCEVLDENTFLLNDFVLEMNGSKVYEGPICGSWHRFFYPAPDGTPFTATYTFESTSDIEGCFAAIEVAENLDSITFNGQSVKPMKQPGELGALNTGKTWLDINFTRVPLPAIRRGTNTLVIEGKKINNVTAPGLHLAVEDWQNHKATEAEEIYICGRFSVNKQAEGMYVVSEFVNPTCQNLTENGFPFYCGQVKYTGSFNLSNGGNAFIRLNGVSAACADVTVNGKRCGTTRWEPMLIDISDACRAGENTIEIRMATTLVNAFGPNRISGIKESPYVGPTSFIDFANFKSGYELFDFGLESIGIYSG